MDTRLINLTLALRIAFGLMATLAGLDKFFNLLADWESYVAPSMAALLPIAPSALMMIVGVVEIAVGVTILFLSPAIGAYVAAAWLTLVAVNLVIGGYLDVAVRDLVLALSALTFARLVELGVASTASASPRLAHQLIP